MWRRFPTERSLSKSWLSTRKRCGASTRCPAWTALPLASSFPGGMRAASGQASSFPRMATSASRVKKIRARSCAPSRPGFSRRSVFPLLPGETSTNPTGNNGNTERREKPGRDGAQLRARIFFTRLADVAIRGKLEAWPEAARIPPGNDDAKGNAVHAGQRVDAPHRFLVESHDLLRRLSVGKRQHIHREHVMRA